MRIYCIYKPEHIWFENIGKTTTNSKLRYLIPISKDKSGLGILMIYPDMHFAKYWNDLYIQNSKREFHIIIQQHLQMLFPNIHMPRPMYSVCKYWENGVGYWKPKYDSEILSEKILHINPLIPLYICGENYSDCQGWIEGALRTARIVISNIA